jgi:hypothetical protein
LKDPQNTNDPDSLDRAELLYEAYDRLPSVGDLNVKILRSWVNVRLG